MTITMMAFPQVRFALVLVAAALASATPASKPAFWKGTAFDTTIEEMRALCANDDAIACLKYKFMSVLDGFFKKDNFQITENVEVSRNSFTANEVTSSRSESSLEDNVQEYLQSHDVTFKLPMVGSSVTVGARNLDQDEIDFKLRLSGANEVQARKAKLKKIIIPIFIFILLKAITLIPLALGVLGLKAWNALQLSFFSFVISIALAVFQLCKKIAADGAHPQIAAHGPWEAAYSSQYASRSFEVQPALGNEEEAQKLAYAAYV